MTANRTDIPAFTYPIPLKGAKTQCVSTADRPVAALINCLGNLEALTGQARALSLVQRKAPIVEGLASYDVPYHRAELWARALAGARLSGVPSTVGPITLDPYQVAAAEHMTVAGGVMALSCGLGKTATAVAAAIASGPHTRLWIVCPINAFPTWRRWFPMLRERFAEVRIVSVDSLHKAHPAAVDGGVVIFDEVHMLGVAKTRRTGHAHRIRTAFDVGLCLTGTLLHGGVEKTLSMLDLAVPGLARFANRWCAGEYFNCLVRKQLGTRKVTDLVRPTGPNREAFFRWLSFACVSLNRSSETVRQSVVVPDQHLHTVLLGEPWAPLHDQAAQLALSILETEERVPSAAEVAHRLCREGVQAKLAWLLEAMADNDEAVVVCAEYQDTLDALEEGLREADVSVVRVDGSVTGADRVEAQRQFQAGEVRVFLGQMDAATVSLDLDRACISVGVDHTWKAAAYDQFLGRTARRTQRRECHHFDLVCNHLQAKVTARLREQMDFDASLAEWAAVRVAVKAALPQVPVDDSPNTI